MARRTVPAKRQSTLEQERSRETRSRLLEAGRRLVWARGFENTSVQDIATAAGVSKATFYFYFPTKEALLVELAVASSDVALAATGDLHDPPGDPSTAELLHRLVDDLAQTTAVSPKTVVERSVVELFHSMGRNQPPEDRVGSPGTELEFAL